MTANRLQNLYFVARDLDRAARFYRDILGVELRFEDPGRWVQCRLGDTSIALAAPEEAPSQEVTPGAVAVFELSDLADFGARVTAAGGEVVGERDMGDHGRVLTVRDCEGNLFQVIDR